MQFTEAFMAAKVPMKNLEENMPSSEATCCLLQRLR
jgi:hypothetical protein